MTDATVDQKAKAGADEAASDAKDAARNISDTADQVKKAVTEKAGAAREWAGDRAGVARDWALDQSDVLRDTVQTQAVHFRRRVRRLGVRRGPRPGRPAYPALNRAHRQGGVDDSGLGDSPSGPSDRCGCALACLSRLMISTCSGVLGSVSSVR